MARKSFIDFVAKLAEALGFVLVVLVCAAILLASLQLWIMFIKWAVLQ